MLALPAGVTLHQNAFSPSRAYLGIAFGFGIPMAFAAA